MRQRGVGARGSWRVQWQNARLPVRQMDAWLGLRSDLPTGRQQTGDARCKKSKMDKPAAVRRNRRRFCRAGLRKL